MHSQTHNISELYSHNLEHIALCRGEYSSPLSKPVVFADFPDLEGRGLFCTLIPIPYNILVEVVVNYRHELVHRSDHLDLIAKLPK